MKNLLITVLLLAAFAGAAFAQSSPSPTDSAPSATAPSAAPSAAPAASSPAATPSAAPDSGTPPAPIAPARAPSFLEQELEAASSELSSGQVGSLTMEDVEKIAAHLAIAVQKERYVQRVQRASFMLPGPDNS